MATVLGLSPSVAALPVTRAEATQISAPLPPRRPADLRPSEAAPGKPDPARARSHQQNIAATAPSASASPDSASGPSCIAALTAVSRNRVRAAEVKAADPDCVVADPVIVEALSVRGPEGDRQVVIEPPVTLACEMARAVSGWLDVAVQPLARGHFGRDLASLRVGGGHECRRRNRASAGPLSEHATGRALDVFAFTLAGTEPDASVTVEAPKGLEQSRFLEALRQSACGAFATALGPGSDAAHADHLHIDIMPRRSAASRFCQ